VTERRPWYVPSEKTPPDPVIRTQLETELDTIVVEMPNAPNVAAVGA